MSDEVWKRDEPDSPCQSICLIDPETRFCLGCGRTVEEIDRWSDMTPAERREIAAALPGRDNVPSRRRGKARARRAERIAARRTERDAK